MLLKKDVPQIKSWKPASPFLGMNPPLPMISASDPRTPNCHLWIVRLLRWVKQNKKVSTWATRQSWRPVHCRRSNSRRKQFSVWFEVYLPSWLTNFLLTKYRHSQKPFGWSGTYQMHTHTHVVEKSHHESHSIKTTPQMSKEPRLWLFELWEKWRCFPKSGEESDQHTLPFHLEYVVRTQDWAEIWEHAAATTAENTDISREELLVDTFIILLKMHIK